jgi:chaperonin GroEL
MMLTTEAMIADIPEENRGGHGGGMGGMDMGGMGM